MFVMRTEFQSILIFLCFNDCSLEMMYWDNNLFCAELTQHSASIRKMSIE